MGNADESVCVDMRCVHVFVCLCICVCVFVCVCVCVWLSHLYSHVCVSTCMFYGGKDNCTSENETAPLRTVPWAH